MKFSLSRKKRTLRTKIQKLRKELLSQERLRFSHHAAKRLEKLRVYQKAKRIGLYASDLYELPTQEFFERAVQFGKQVAFPYVVGQRLRFRWVNDWSDLRPGYRNILEPFFGSEVEPDRLEVILVPVVAIDAERRRLGRGRGYYDRLLCAQLRPRVSVGLGFHFQLVTQVPSNPEDQKVDYVVTDQVVIGP